MGHTARGMAPFAWPDGHRAALSLTFDVDAESPILFEHPETAAWLDVMSHQAYGPEVAVPRLLALLADELGDADDQRRFIL